MNMNTEQYVLEFLNEVNLNQFVDTFIIQPCKDEWTVLPGWAFRILCKIGPVLNCIPITNLDDREKMEAEYNEAVDLTHKIAMELRYFEDNIDCGKTVGETDDAMNAIADKLGCRPIEACLDKWAGYVVV
jgi:hypothetical protein